MKTSIYLFQELQRRLDQTLGKPGSYHHGVDREGHVKPMTIGARIYRLENQVCLEIIHTGNRTDLLLCSFSALMIMTEIVEMSAFRGNPGLPWRAILSLQIYTSI